MGVSISLVLEGTGTYSSLPNFLVSTTSCSPGTSLTWIGVSLALQWDGAGEYVRTSQELFWRTYWMFWTELSRSSRPEAFSCFNSSSNFATSSISPERDQRKVGQLYVFICGCDGWLKLGESQRKISPKELSFFTNSTIHE